MKPTLFLRIAAILALIFCVMHTVGGVVAPPAPGAQAAAVEAMQSHSFNVMGHQRTFWDFHVGYGIAITLVLFVHAILFWQLSILAKTDAYKIRPLFIPLFLEFWPSRLSITGISSSDPACLRPSSLRCWPPHSSLRGQQHQHKCTFTGETSDLRRRPDRA